MKIHGDLAMQETILSGLRKSTLTTELFNKKPKIVI
jgi:hypothetical protein